MLKSFLIVMVLIASAYCYPRRSRIQNSTVLDPEKYPFMVSLRSPSGKHTCGGSIVSDEWILTAAHCLEDRSVQTVTIQYGVLRINNYRPNIAKVQKMIFHEHFVPHHNFSNDIALLQLEERLPINGKNIDISKLPKPDFEVPADDMATLIGWGADRSGRIQENLLQVNLKVYSDEECSSRQDGRTTVDNICAGVDEGGKGQCRGDSGGPLIYDGLQVGVVSWSMKPCTVAPYPGVFVKVSHYVDWINENIH